MAFGDFFRRRSAETRSAGNAPLAALGATWLGGDPEPGIDSFAVVQACVAAISQHIAVLPVYVYRREGARRVEVDDHPLRRLHLEAPNAWQSWPDLVEWLLASALLDGNGLAEIIADEGGRITELRPIPWGLVRVEVLPTGRVVYHVTGNDVIAPQGTTRRLRAGEVVHLRARTGEGVVGVSPLRRALAATSTAVLADRHTRSMWRDSQRPGGVFATEKKLGTSGLEFLRTSIDSFFAGGRKGRTMILEDGLTYMPFPTPSPEDQELIAARRFSVEEIARVFSVPPPMIGDLTNGTFTNAETMLRFFATGTLAFWVRKLEAELARSAFTETERRTLEVDIDMSALLRGDPSTRWANHKIALENQILAVDEIREIEGWSPMEAPNAL